MTSIKLYYLQKYVKHAICAVFFLKGRKYQRDYEQSLCMLPLVPLLFPTSWGSKDVNEGSRMDFRLINVIFSWC